MTQYEKSAITLELPAVLSMLAAEAVSAGAKERALALRPSADEAEVRRRLAETGAAVRMTVLGGSPSFSGVRDIKASVSRAVLGGSLNTRELMDIAGVLSAARVVRNYPESCGLGEKTEIDFLFAALRPNKFLETKITGSISGENELSDSASPELADIRRHIRAASERVRSALQKIISSPSYANALQEPIITTRSERFVVPVKAERRSSVPGLVHDVSASGATLFIEPMAAVRANNELRELQAKEKAETERILAELSADCAEHSGEIESDYSLLLTLDLIFAKAKLSWKMDAAAPGISRGKILLRRARHPLLPKGSAVPIDLEFGGEYDTLVITGPNTGGKTVTLKTIGLLCVMAACGLNIPAADGSELPVFDGVLADIGDEQSIEQNLSTFSSHMTNIVRMLGECGSNTLILFDELGAGTDPVEGAALAVSVIEYARRRGASIAATTHYAELKLYATTEKGVLNASCEFDVATLRPTYRLLVGIPGKSNAFAISGALGLPEEIISDARKRVGRENAGFESGIEKLEQLRQKLENDREEAAQKLAEAEENRRESAKVRIELELRLEKSGLKAKREAQRIIDNARETAEAAFAELDRMKSRLNEEESHDEVNRARALLRRSLNEAEEELSEPAEELPREEIRPSRPAAAGDTVELLNAGGVRARVDSLTRDGRLNVFAGSVRTTVSQSDVRVVEDGGGDGTSGGVSLSGLRSGPVPAELDLRGMESAEALSVLENYIDSALMAGIGSATIIHGKGTGVLRKAVQDALRRSRRIKSFRLGRYGEGDTGVTVVEFRRQ